jgi:hypothetical protein
LVRQIVTKRTPAQHFFSVWELRKFLQGIDPDAHVYVRELKPERPGETTSYFLEVSWGEDVS